MTLGDLSTLRERLGGNVGLTYACALKKAAGFAGSRWFDVDAVIVWKAAHPAWKSTDVYVNGATPQRPRSRKGRKAATAGKSCEQS